MSQPSAGTHATAQAFSAALCDFLNLDLPNLHPKVRKNHGVGPETPLFTSGIIDSMAILHLIGFVELATGRAIPSEKVLMKHFRTVADITASFWQPPEPS